MTVPQRRPALTRRVAAPSARTLGSWVGAVVVLALVALGAPLAVADAGQRTNPLDDAVTGGVAVGQRIMPLGDSITDGLTVEGGYRIGLWKRLVDAGRQPDFVGSAANGPDELGDHDHEGHSGWRIDEIDERVTGWLTDTKPEVVLLHIGTNDMIQDHEVATAPDRLATLIGHITAAVPQAQVYVATIIRMTDPQWQARAQAFNAEVPAVVAAAGPQVHVVEMADALTDADLADGVHPNDGGYDKMAALWFAALSAAGVPAASSAPPPSMGALSR